MTSDGYSSICTPLRIHNNSQSKHLVVVANFLIFARLLVFEQRLATLQAVSQNFWSQNGHVLVTLVLLKY